jgi:hypothetical protein
MATEYLGIENEGKPKSNVEYPSGPEWAFKVVTLPDGRRLMARLARCTKCSSLRNDIEEVEGVLLTACSVRGDTVHARRPDSRDAVCGVPNINVADDPFDRTSAWSCKRCLAALGEEVQP